jgi:hypothetical protein
MPHQMKGIGNGRQNVPLLILTLGKVLEKGTMKWGQILHIYYNVYKIICVIFFCLFLLMEIEFCGFFHLNPFVLILEINKELNIDEVS